MENMDEEATENFFKAGEIAAKAQQIARKVCKPGASKLQAANEIEHAILELGGTPAFPVNLSVNDQAAHYTPSFEDTGVFGEKDVLKVDLGVHVDGYLSDCAFTLDFSGEYGKLIEASNEALRVAVEMAKPGVNVKQIGKAIQHEIEKRGFKPIANLTGHSLEQYLLHAGVVVPNVEGGNYVLKEGDTLAIEPFATTGAGSVRDDSVVEILMLEDVPRVRQPFARELADLIAEEFATLPFAKRWLYDFAQELPDSTPLKVGLAIRELVSSGCLYEYPALLETGKGIVSQSETCIIVTSDGCKPTVPLPK